MWNWFNCYLSGRHEYGPWCEPGAMFLRCIHCGRRSAGWAIESKATPRPIIHAHARPAAAASLAAGPARVVPFPRSIAS
jgi:hypothetical protein